MQTKTEHHASPRLPQGMVERACVLDAWEANRKMVCHFLLGPAGSGKTTLGLQWRSRLISDGFDVAWMSMHADDEPEVFIEAMLAAFLAIAPRICQEAHLLYNRNGRALSPNAIAVSLIRGVERNGRETLLVIDDYQHVGHHETHAMLDTLLEYAPQNFHVLVISRSVPPLSVERLRAAKQLYELDVQDLRFSFQETQEFARQRLPMLAPDAIRRLHNLTDGWVAGLQLLSLGIMSQPQRTQWCEPIKNAHDFIAYFNREVLYQLDPASLEGLLRLSPVRNFSEPLVVEMLGAAGGQNLMAMLQRERMFIMAVDNGPLNGWWRFHPLFRELLLERFEQLPNEQRRRTRIRLGNWFGRHGLLRDAVQNLVAAGEIHQAADWIERHARELFLNGELQRLVRAISEIPKSYLHERHSLTLWLGWSQLCYRQFDSCRESIVRIERHALRGVPAQLSGRLSIQAFPEYAHVCLLKFSLALQNDDLEGAQALLPEMLQMRDQRDAVLQGGRRNLLAWYFSHLGLPDEARLHLQGPGHYREDGHILLDSSFGSLMSAALLGMTYLHESDYRSAEASLRGALGSAQRSLGSHCEAACNAAGLLSEVLYEVNDLESVRQLVEHQFEAIEKAALPDSQLSATLAKSRLHAFERNFYEAHETLLRLEVVADERRMLRITAVLLYEHFGLCLRSGTLQDARPYLLTLDALAVRALQGQHPAAQKIAQHAALAHAEWHLHRLDEPGFRRAVDSLQAHPQLTGRLRSKADALTAIAQARAGYKEMALATALQVLHSSREMGIVRSLLDVGGEFLDLVRQVQAKIGDSDQILGIYVDRLLLHADHEASPSNSSSTAVPRLDALSERELQILRLLVNALPNKRIAQALGVSPETIKWHLKNIYSKIAVFSRDEAIVMARQMGLVAGAN